MFSQQTKYFPNFLHKTCQVNVMLLGSSFERIDLFMTVMMMMMMMMKSLTRGPSR